MIKPKGGPKVREKNIRKSVVIERSSVFAFTAQSYICLHTSNSQQRLSEKDINYIWNGASILVLPYQYHAFSTLFYTQASSALSCIAHQKEPFFGSGGELSSIDIKIFKNKTVIFTF